MDLEHSVLSSGIKYGYSVEQNTEEITVVIKADESEKEKSYNIIKDSKEIIIRDPKDNLLLAGTLFDPKNEPTVKFNENSIQVLIQKLHNDPWPLLMISETSNGIIDGKSAFLLALFYDAQLNYSETWKYIEKSANSNYYPALLFMAEALSDKKNPYSDVDLNKTIQLFHKILNIEVNQKAVLSFYNILKQNGCESEAEQYLLKCEQTDEISLILAKMYSPHTGSINKPEEAIKRFKILASKGNKEAMLELAWHLENSSGIERDLIGAADLRREALEAAPLSDSANQTAQTATDDQSTQADRVVSFTSINTQDVSITPTEHTESSSQAVTDNFEAATQYSIPTTEASTQSNKARTAEMSTQSNKAPMSMSSCSHDVDFGPKIESKTAETATQFENSEEKKIEIQLTMSVSHDADVCPEIAMSTPESHRFEQETLKEVGGTIEHTFVASPLKRELSEGVVTEVQIQPPERWCISSDDEPLEAENEIEDVKKSEWRNAAISALAGAGIVAGVVGLAIFVRRRLNNNNK